MAVLSKDIYSPQSFVEAITGKYYIFNIDNSIFEEIQTLLCLNGYTNLWNGSVADIDYVVKNNLDVVLVDISDFDEKMGKWVQEYYWFEIPKSCRNNFDNENI